MPIQKETIFSDNCQLSLHHKVEVLHITPAGEPTMHFLQVSIFLGTYKLYKGPRRSHDPSFPIHPERIVSMVNHAYKSMARKFYTKHSEPTGTVEDRSDN